MIIPVYELLVLGDMIIFNVIEFWGGDTSLPSTAEADSPASQVEIVSASDDHVQFRRGGATFDVRQIEPGVVELSRDGIVLGLAHIDESGSIGVRDHKGQMLQNISADDAQMAGERLSYVAERAPAPM